jgi:toxin ParE1/3/4
MELIWRESALDNLETIIAYIAERNGPAAGRLKSAIDACAEGLTKHPFLYRAGRAPGTS